MNITLGKGHQTHLLQRDGTSNTIVDFRSIYFDITLTPDQETGIVNSTAKGTGTAVLNAAQDELSFNLQVTGIDLDGTQTGSSTDNMTAAHFHTGLPGVSGPPVFGITGDETTVINGPAGTVEGLWDASESLSGVNLTNLLNDALYVNIHTPAFPAGEIRGQVLQADEGLDRIDLRELNIGSLTQLKAITRTVEGSAQISFNFEGVENLLEVSGVQERDLASSHFIFATKAGTEDGTGLNDDLFAARKGSVLNGLDGNDRLFGSNASDDLSGGAGNDRLIGGRGLDDLNGGTGRDRFIFLSAEDSSATLELADTIAAFQPGKDRLDLRQIDADHGTTGDQAFTYINEDAFSAAGQVRQYVLEGFAITELNVDADLTADMVIKIANGVKWAGPDLDA